jgi:deferrochelatase/peroxidase EfeB
MSVDFGNVQGLIVRGYGYPISRHLLFTWDGGAESASWLRWISPRLTTALPWNGEKPACLLNLGLTFNGLARLGLPAATLAAFPADFREPPDFHMLGDYGSSHPKHWWGTRFQTGEIYAILHLYGQSVEAIAAFTAEVRSTAARLGIRELLATDDGLPLEGRARSGDKEHFGFRDGLAQPNVAWSDEPGDHGTVSFRHFLLGYSTSEIVSNPRAGAAGALVRDSGYSAFRWMYQDVAAFERFLEEQAPRLGPDLRPEQAKELVAAKLVGRWRDGTPLVLSPEAPATALAARDDFNFGLDDRDGLKCPFSAHIRVVNPRDQRLDPIAGTVVPRVIRRGEVYGPELRSTVDDGKDRGLLGLFICASIERQFYKLMGWMKANNFSPVFNNHLRGQDGLCGNREVPDASSDFVVPGGNGPLRLRGLPTFVRTKGTAFFLLPSLSMLRTLCGDTTVN